jgi:hypothetical protein
MPFGCKARIARNSWLLRRFATQKLGILGARYEFMNRLEVPKSFYRLVAWQDSLTFLLRSRVEAA